MRKCELELELYEAPKMVVLSAVVERGFTVSGQIGVFDESSGEHKDDWKDGEDYDW